MIIVIGGVTASGKSDLAFKLAKAINGVIINADAYAIYKELNIGTAKPSLDELNSVPTYLFNIINLNENYSIYNYQQDARAIIKKYENTNTPLIFVGGSGLYIRAALHDYTLEPEDPEPIIDDSRISNLTLYQKLLLLDRAAASKIHPNNRRRILRALAILKKRGDFEKHAEQKRAKIPLYPYIMVTLDADPLLLENRIRRRTKKMLEEGLRAEVEALNEKYPGDVQGLKAIGYKEIIANKNESDEFLIDLISLRTRQLAKKQRTFFRHQFKSTWFDNNEEALAFLKERYKGFKNDKKH
ncbi:MAG: tRNA (adenosine(37)-N6)-dimethylallyltransferase MiaA [Bacilli bacterium]